MVTLPNGDIFVCTPRTASRAIMEALMRAYPDAKNTYPYDHHIHPEEVPLGGRIFGTVRDPYTHLISWFNNTYAGGNDTFQQFLDNYESKRFLPFEGFPGGYRLNMYGSVITDFLLFEDGVEHALAKMGVDYDYVDVVGKTHPRPDMYKDGKYVEQIERQFAKDLELYRSVRGE